MSIFIGLRFTENSLEHLNRWVQSRKGIDRPVHISKLKIPLGYDGGLSMDEFQPLGAFEPRRIDTSKNLTIGWLGERRLAILVKFQCDWIKDRIEQLVNAGFKRRHKKHICRIPITHNCTYLDMGWLQGFPKYLEVCEEFSTPFSQDYMTYAHLAGHN